MLDPAFQSRKDASSRTANTPFLLGFLFPILHGLTPLQSITARVDPEEESVNIYLYDDWYHVDINIGDYFHVIHSLLED